MLLFSQFNPTGTMDLFCTTTQIDEQPLIDISPDAMSDEALAALLEVTVDELLGLTWTDDIPDPAV